MTWSVLGIDPSMTSTGFAHLAEGDAKPTWGTLKFPPWGDSEGKYLWEWFEFFGHLCTEKKVTHIFIEDCRFRTSHVENLTQMIASIGLIGQACIVAHLLTQRGQPVELFSVQPQVWRKVFLGAMPKPEGISKPMWRKMLKEAAIAQCHKRGWIVEGDDPAEALGIATYGACTIDPKFLNQQGGLFRRAENDVDKFIRENK